MSLSGWLELMLAEIARKRAEGAEARAERERRARESAAHALDSGAREPAVSGTNLVESEP
ncbi:MAG TPA: hypothetical protein VMU67_12385 [Steroidobacteraceae bacterium]|nr:hypothetical protein [Steroidobacteraceae bacterium]